ncbi:MAG TPA: sugar nucleotide-binding protein, partial [Chitinophagaceae bacterium]|nr:sugar nucleotide-binding protein [Chitinophagaceae bacterium]
MQTVLVTGANGFLGQYLVEKLLLNNFKVIATSKGESRLRSAHPNLAYETLDFTDAPEVTRIFLLHKPAVVVHSGAWSKPDDCERDKKEAFEINVTGTINLLKAAEAFESHFVFLSTDFIFSGEKGFYKEEDEAGPVNYYGKTKFLAEQEVVKFPWLYSIVRTVLVYGDPRGGRDNILTM